MSSPTRPAPDSCLRRASAHGGAPEPGDLADSYPDTRVAAIIQPPVNA
jgi:hypothetical protein